LWSSEAQVIQQAFTHLIEEGVDQLLASFVSSKTDLVLSPLKVVQLQGADLATAHTVGVEQLKDRDIASASTRRTVDTVQGLLRILLRDRPRNPGQLVGA
jgi:hypothetical protein